VTSKSQCFKSDKFKSGGMYEKHAVATWTLIIFRISGRRKKTKIFMRPEIKINLIPEVQNLGTTSNFKGQNSNVKQVPC